MKNTAMSLMVKTCVVLVALLGVLICAFWYPFILSLLTVGPVDVVPTPEQELQFYSMLAFHWITSIPCFIILLLIWQIADDIKRDTVFHVKTVRRFRGIVCILFVDLIIFIIGNIASFMIGWNDLALAYLCLAVVGLVIMCGFAIASHYVMKATALKEELEGVV